LAAGAGCCCCILLLLALLDLLPDGLLIQVIQALAHGITTTLALQATAAPVLVLGAQDDSADAKHSWFFCREVCRVLTAP
jgi:hypothetical protein